MKGRFRNFLGPICPQKNYHPLQIEFTHRKVPRSLLCPAVNRVHQGKKISGSPGWTVFEGFAAPNQPTSSPDLSGLFYSSFEIKQSMHFALAPDISRWRCLTGSFLSPASCLQPAFTCPSQPTYVWNTQPHTRRTEKRGLSRWEWWPCKSDCFEGKQDCQVWWWGYWRGSLAQIQAHTHIYMPYEAGPCV